MFETKKCTQLLLINQLRKPNNSGKLELYYHKTGPQTSRFMTFQHNIIGTGQNRHRKKKKLTLLMVFGID